MLSYTALFSFTIVESKVAVAQSLSVVKSEVFYASQIKRGKKKRGIEGENCRKEKLKIETNFVENNQGGTRAVSYQ